MSATEFVTLSRRSILGRKQIVAFVIVGCLLLPFYRYELSPDGISYLSIADEYAHGYWHHALNAYWGPLYSWLLAVLLLLRVPGILATRIVNLGAGVAALLALTRLCRRFPMRPRLAQAMLWIAALILLSYVIESNTPDLLFTAILLLYISILFDPDYARSRHAGIACGVLGALSFYTKSYGFAFFLCHFCLFSVIAYFASRDTFSRRRVVQHLVFGLSYFLLLCACWILLLHGKFGGWGLGNTGEFNRRLVGPQASGYPHLRGLMVPYSRGALFVWQDPLPSTLPSWSLQQGGVAHELKLIETNLEEVIYFWGRESILVPVFLIGYVALCFRKSNDEPWEWVYPLATIGLLSAGYILLTVQDRYFWLAELLFLLVAFRALDLLFEQKALRPAQQALFTCIIALSFLVSPLRALRGHFRQDARLYAEVQSIKQTGKLQAPFASCENWAQSAYLAYFSQKPYYGVIVPEQDADAIARDLNPDFQPLSSVRPSLGAAQRALSSAHVDNVIMWPDCPIDAAALGSVIAKAGDMQLVRVNE